MPDNFGDMTRAERLRSLYDDEVDHPERQSGGLTGRSKRLRQLAGDIARESPDTPVRDPLEVFAKRLTGN